MGLEGSYVVLPQTPTTERIEERYIFAPKMHDPQNTDCGFTNCPELDCECPLDLTECVGTKCHNCQHVVVAEGDNTNHYVCGICDSVYCQEYCDIQAYCDVCPSRICYNCRSYYKKEYCKVHLPRR